MTYTTKELIKYYKNKGIEVDLRGKKYFRLDSEKSYWRFIPKIKVWIQRGLDKYLQKIGWTRYRYVMWIHNYRTPPTCPTCGKILKLKWSGGVNGFEFVSYCDKSCKVSYEIRKGSHPWVTRPDGTNLQTDRVKAGTHNLLKRSDGTSVASDLVKSGKHHFLTRVDGTSLTSDRTNLGLNPLSRRPDGTSVTSDRVIEKGDSLESP